MVYDNEHLTRNINGNTSHNNNFKISLHKEPPCSMSFYNESQVLVGALTWSDGVFKFEGSADKSAQIFIEALNIERIEDGKN